MVPLITSAIALKPTLNLFTQHHNQGLEGVQNIPTILQVQDKIYGYASGSWISLAAKVTANEVIIQAPQGIKLEAAPNSEYHFVKVRENGFGTGFTLSLAEVSVSVGLSTMSAVQREETKQYLVNEFRSNVLILDTKQVLKNEGSIINSKRLTSSSEDELNLAVYDHQSCQIKFQDIFVGMKIGFTSGLGQVYDKIKRLESTFNTERNGIDSKLNQASASLTAYNSLMSNIKTRGSIAFGVWAESSYHRHSSKISHDIGVPVRIYADEYYSVSTTRTDAGTQAHLGRATIDADYWYIVPTHESLISSSSSIDGKVKFGEQFINGDFAHAKQDHQQTSYINSRIQVRDDLELNIRAMADLKGARIEAKQIRGIVNQLLLASVQDIAQHREWALSVGISLTDLLGLSNLRVKDSTKNSALVREISAILGEKVDLVIAHTLYLTGSMIATAKSNPDGSLTETGNLRLAVGELVIEHLHDYVDGSAIGAGWLTLGNQASNSYNPFKGEYNLIFGNTDLSREVRATIGNGEVLIANNPAELDKASRGTTSVLPRLTGDDFYLDLSFNPNNPIESLPTKEEVTNFLPGMLRDAQAQMKSKLIAWGVIPVSSGAIPKSDEQPEEEEVQEEQQEYIKADNTQSLTQEEESEEVTEEAVDSDHNKNTEPSQAKVNQRIEIQRKEIFDQLQAQLSSVEGREQHFIFKRLDQVYIVSKHVIGGGIVMTKAEFAKKFPEQYETLAEYSDQLGTFIGEKVQALEAKLSDILGKKYESFKYYAKEIFADVDKNAPQMVSDWLSLFRWAVAGKVVVEAVGAGIKLVKGKTEKLLKDTTDVSITKDRRLDGLSSDANYHFFDNIHVHEMFPAESANHILSKWYDKPPFLAGTKVVKFITDGEMEFVRLYAAGETKLYGQFVALYDDVLGLSSQQLKDKFDLPNLPTHLSIVKPPKGTEMMNGIVQAGNFGGSGRGTQFYFTKEVKDIWFEPL